VLEGGVDPQTTVVYSCAGADVEMVVVDGEVLVTNKKLVKMDEGEIIASAKEAIKGI